MSGKSNRLQEAKEKSIVTFLENAGVKVKKQGSKHWCSSPFSSDSNWSFAIYPNNTYFDWSTGEGGDIIDLVCSMNNSSVREAIDYILGNSIPKFSPISETKKEKKPFNIKHYLLEESQEVDSYAQYRGFKEYEAGKWMIPNGDDWIEVPSIMFRHYDENFNLIGARFRTVENERERIGKLTKRIIPKFSSRGDLGWYILENNIQNFKTPVVYVMESETSAVSLHQYFIEQEHPAVILCFGGVNNKLRPIPEKYAHLNKYLLIDYDGDEDKFYSRIEKIGLKNAEPLRLILEKGEDINSLYCRGEMYKISYLLQ